MGFDDALNKAKDFANDNPDKVEQLCALGVDVAARVPTGVHLTETNAAYLATKVRRQRHDLQLPAI